MMSDANLFPPTTLGSGYTMVSTSDVLIVKIQDENSEWKTIMEKQLDRSDQAKDLNIDVMLNMVGRDGSKEPIVTLSLKGNHDSGFQFYTTSAPGLETLRFHNVGGKNIEFYNAGKSARKTYEEADLVIEGVLTNRPLKDYELFEVKIDKMIQKYVNSLGIGITILDPKTIDYSKWMWNGTIMLYKNRVSKNGKVIKSEYGVNLDYLKVGDRVGVMKRSNGDLHFFVNGADLGVAATGVSGQIYGVLDLYGNAVEATLVEGLPPLF